MLVYIEPLQERFLKGRAREMGVTQAELIRDGIELLDSARPSGASPGSALKAFFGVIEERMRMQVPQTGREWTREDLYEERVARNTR